MNPDPRPDKRCPDCGEVKPRADYHVLKTGRFPPYCKICTSKHRIIYLKSGRGKATKEQRRLAFKRYMLKYPERYRAWVIYKRAIRNGSLVSPRKCEQCGFIGQVQAHHHDYSKPLDVHWFCQRCHRAQHGRLLA